MAVVTSSGYAADPDVFLQTSVQRQIEANRLKQQQFEFKTMQDNRNEVLAMFKSMFGGGNEGAMAIPNEFKQNIDLFQPGGGFGEGARADIQRGFDQTIAAGQTGSVITGMSTGTGMDALGARASADATGQRLNVNDARIKGLNGALTATGTAKLSAAEIAARTNTAFMQAMGSFR